MENVCCYSEGDLAKVRTAKNKSKKDNNLENQKRKNSTLPRSLGLKIKYVEVELSKEVEVGKDKNEVDTPLVESKKVICVEVFDILLVANSRNEHGLGYEAKG